MNNSILMCFTSSLLTCVILAGEVKEEKDALGIMWAYEIRNECFIKGARRIGPSANLGKLTIPATLGGRPVFCIDQRAFKNQGDLTEVVVSSGVRQICREAFAGCTNLVSVYMEDGDCCVNGIDGDAFAHCQKLASVRLPDGLCRISSYAFEGCNSLLEVKLPEHCLTAFNGFEWCKGLKRIEIGRTYYFEAQYATLPGCESLFEIVVPTNDETFAVWNGILYSKDGKFLVRCPPRLPNGEIKVRDGVIGICPMAFESCTIKSVSLPDSLKAIGYGAFQGCTNLVSLTIPADLILVDGKAFHGCRSLRTVVFLGKKRPEIGEDAFPECTKLLFPDSTSKPKD